MQFVATMIEEQQSFAHNTIELEVKSLSSSLNHLYQHVYNIRRSARDAAEHVRRAVDKRYAGFGFAPRKGSHGKHGGSHFTPRQPRSSDAVDEALARQLSRQGFGSNAPSSSRTGKGKPTTLPEDFLRVPGGVNSISDDEALARMLQDELFTEELSRNPDFAHLARGRSNYGTRAPSSSGPAAVNPVGAAANRLGEFASRFTGQQQQRTGSNRNLNNNNNVPQSPNIMDKISELGDNAKRRLQLLAAQFNANANNNNSNRAAAGGTANSPGAGEFRGLLDDDDNDNMELAARKDL
jgi:hypothetical protein